ncbi:MAG: DMT family transporter [Candidatus Omnitrophica bacterium]|nr:DMT family transporter [Candidatus Omnitrophota bacterium]MDD4013580.1 DMT family transporter [Candidatus Omnitrophota bacterium]
MDYRVLGAAAALLSSAAWALGPVLFRKIGDKVSPLGINLSKGIIGTGYLVIILLMTGFEPVTFRDTVFLGLSGILGIALGDTFFFMGLMRLGARMAVLLETLCPVVTVVLAVILLGERPSIPAWTGICLTVSGVNIVIWERAPRLALKGNWGSGIKFAALSVTATSLGIILAKIGVRESSPVQATAIRLAGGTLALGLWGLAGKRTGEWLAPLKERSLFTKMASAVFVSVCVGLLFSVVALKYTDASIAVPLNSTSPLFVLPMAALAFGEKITIRSFLGALVTVAGVTLIFLNS